MAAALVAVLVAAAGLVAVLVSRDEGLKRESATATSAADAAASATGPANLDDPRGIAVDAAGTLYVADGSLLVTSGSVIRRVDRDGIISTVVSDEADLSTRAINALADDSILVARPSQILRIASDGTVTVVAGTSVPGIGGDGGSATSAQFAGIAQMAVDSQGGVVIADATNNRVRRVAPDGIVTTVAGTGGSTTLRDGRTALETDIPSPSGVPALDATFGLIGNIAVDADGNLFILDIFNNRVRRLAANGTVTTVA